MTVDKRRMTRHRCRMRVQIRARNRDYYGYVVNVSKGGMRLATDQIAEIWVGDWVEISSSDFGLVTGETRWRAPHYIGVQFNDSTNNNAKVAALLRQFRLQA